MGHSGHEGEAMKWCKGSEKGFTFVELLVAIPIMGLLGLAMGAVLIQLVRSDRVNQSMLAVRQVEIAGDRVSQDGVQAQYVTFGTSMTSTSGFLNLRWAGEWIDDSGTYNNRSENVTYTLVPVNGRYNLQRHETIQLKVGAAAPTNTDLTSIVGQYLDASQMSCQWLASDNNTLGFKVVSVVGNKTEERTYNITPRE
jgi:prepilin-type N-terminal cleavage/methylation domain-containing protein